MVSIRNQLRVRFAVTISILLVACSAAIWLWGRYLADRQVRELLLRDANRLSSAITWNPDLAAFELRPNASTIAHELNADYWRINDAAGKRVWTSDTTGGQDFERLVGDTRAVVHTAPTSSGETWFALCESSVRSLVPARRSMLQDFPEAVTHVAREMADRGAILATELEFVDERLIYEVTVRRGDELLEVCMDGDGVVVERSVHRVPATLPEPVLRTLRQESPGARVNSFDWRASQGRLQFIVNATATDGSVFRRCITSAGDIVPLHFPADAELGRPVEFHVLVAGPHHWRTQVLRNLGVLLAVVCGAGLLATLIISEWLTHRTLGPIGGLAREAGRIDDRRLSERLRVAHPEDEIGHLALAINSMLDRIETAFERQRRFARDASHELRGPLTGLIAHLELAEAAHPPTGDGHLALALERAQRLRDLVEKLLLLARQDSDQPVGLRDDVDLRECLLNVAADFSAEQAERIELSPAPASAHDTLVRANEELLHSMFRNILENALKFSPADATVNVRLASRNGWHVVDVEDRGPGIPDDLRARVFEPFIRLGGSAKVEGAGLGLSIVRWIAQIHGARIHIDSSGGTTGTRFTVELPEAPTST